MLKYIFLLLVMVNICFTSRFAHGESNLTDSYVDSLVRLFDDGSGRLENVLKNRRGVIARNGYYEILKDSTATKKLKAFASFRLGEYFLAVNRADSAVVRFEESNRLCQNCFSSDTSSLIALASVLNEKYFDKDGNSNVTNIPTSDSFYTLQVGVFSSKANADKTSVKMMKILGQSHIKDSRIGNKLFYKVLVGKFKSVSEANKIGSTFLKPRDIEYRVVKY